MKPTGRCRAHPHGDEMPPRFDSEGAVHERGRTLPAAAVALNTGLYRSDRTRDARPRGPLYAALDLGTNNCRLLIAQPALHGFRVIDAFSRIVRLGEGLASSQRLSEDAITRAIEALKVCASKINAKGATRTCLVATEACRLAENGQDFIDRVADETKLKLQIVDRQTEAYLAAAGCASLAAPEAEGIVLFDIGGGSTEIVWLAGRQERTSISKRMRAWTSLPAGVVTLAERHGGREVDRASFEAMVAEVDGHLAAFKRRAASAARAGGFHLLGTSGTVTTIAGVHLNLPRYDRRFVDGLWMDEQQVTGVIDRLLDMPYEMRAANPCVGTDRADLVIAGCAILEAIRRAFPSPRLRIADRGLREGMLMKMMREDGVWRRRHR